ncbi:hypothetical protein MO867_22665, partial [Microbulbifer sp. OS29]
YIKHESSVSTSLLDGLEKEYQILRTDNMTGQMPKVGSCQDFKKLIGLDTVFIHQINRGDGIPYIGFLFGCKWEPEHGLGILMHGNRVVEIGFADTAFTLWVAEDDVRG